MKSFMLMASLLASSPANVVHSAHRRGCVKLYSVPMGKRAANTVYSGTRNVTHRNLLMLGRMEMCQRIPRNQAVLRTYDRRLDTLHKERISTAQTSGGWSGPWACIARYESGGNPSENTGNGFYGGLQFSIGTWAAYGGVGNPADASIAEQEAVAERVLQAQGWNAWPSTSRMCGL